MKQRKRGSNVSVQDVVDRLLLMGMRVRREDAYTLRATCPCCLKPDKLVIRSHAGPIPRLRGVDDAPGRSA